MTQRACLWLEHTRPRLDKKVTDRLFLGRYGQSLRNGTVTRSFGEYIKSVLPHKKGACHILRHSFATLLLEGDINLRALQELLGHSFLSTTQIYMKTTNKFIEKEFVKAHPFF